MTVASTTSFASINGKKSIFAFFMQSFSTKDTEEIGRMIGTAILCQFKKSHPIHGLYLSGDMDSGKSTLLAGVVQSFDNGKNFSAKKLRRPQHHKDVIQTYPKVVHRDILKDSIQKCLKQTSVEEDELLLVEWANHLPINWMEKDRISIEIWKQGSEARTITINGHGNGLIAIQKMAKLLQKP